MLLPVQHVFGPGPVEQVLLACTRCVPARRGPGWLANRFCRWHARRDLLRWIFRGRPGERGRGGGGGLGGSEEAESDLCPSDKEEGADGVEGGFVVVAGDEGFGDVQGERDRAGEDQWTSCGADDVGGSAVQGEVACVEERHDGEVDGWRDEGCRNPSLRVVSVSAKLGCVGVACGGPTIRSCGNALMFWRRLRRLRRGVRRGGASCGRRGRVFLGGCRRAAHRIPGLAVRRAG